MHYLCRRGIRVPSDVSLVCTDDDPAFAFCDPAVSRLRWDSRPVIHRIQKWAANVSRHRPDFQQTLTPCVFLPGGTTAAPRRA
jgi:DNA-binding LacI/PurR family transcriptional regulator